MRNLYKKRLATLAKEAKKVDVSPTPNIVEGSNEMKQLEIVDPATAELKSRISEVASFVEKLQVNKTEIEKERANLTAAISEPKQFWKENSKIMRSLSTVWDYTSSSWAASKARKDLKKYFVVGWTTKVEQFTSDISHIKKVLDKVECD